MEFAKLLLTLVIILLFLLIIRQLFLWYIKRNKQLEKQDEIIRLLKKQVGEEKNMQQAEPTGNIEENKTTNLGKLRKNFVRLRDKQTGEMIDIHKDRWEKEKKEGNPDRYKIIDKK